MQTLKVLSEMGARYADDNILYSALIGKQANKLNGVSPCELIGKNSDELQAIYGITKRSALLLHAALELSNRSNKKIITIIRSSTDIYNVFSSLAYLSVEEFHVLYLNKTNKIIKSERHSFGSIDATIVDVRIICKNALLCNATGLVLCHNHPSGTVKPSEPDVKITKLIYNALLTFNIKLIDHVIISGKQYEEGESFYSFVENGII